MIKAKALWEDSQLRLGGFYELAIEVSGNLQRREEIEEFLESVFDLDFVHGPLDAEFRQSRISVDMTFGYGEGIGYLEVDGHELPFKIIFISEEEEKGSNWLDICFYTAMYEKVLGQQYQTWATSAKWHKGLDDLLSNVLAHVNNRRRIRIGVIGFEVSGMYYLETLREYELKENDVSHTKFFVNEDAELKPENWAKVNIINSGKKNSI